MHITYAENQSLIILDPALGCSMAKNQEPNPPARGPKQVQKRTKIMNRIMWVGNTTTNQLATFLHVPLYNVFMFIPRYKKWWRNSMV